MSLKAHSLRALSAVPLKTLDSPERVSLHRACQGALVCSVLEYGIKPELDLLARLEKLPKSLADKVGGAAVKAGWYCRVNGTSSTPRASLCARSSSGRRSMH